MSHVCLYIFFLYKMVELGGGGYAINGAEYVFFYDNFYCEETKFWANVDFLCPISYPDKCTYNSIAI